MAGKVVLSSGHLEAYLLDCIYEAVDKATEYTLDRLCQYILVNWYQAYTPRKYERTYNFLESVSKTDISVNRNGEVKTLLFFDIEKIIPQYRANGFHAHMGDDLKSVAPMIPRMIERGAYFRGRGRTKGLGSMEETISYLENNFHKLVKKELEKMGLKVVVT